MKHRTVWTCLLSCVLAACTGTPDGVQPVQHFDVEQYLGTWYEIARLDHRFERGLTNVSAMYTLRDDGGVDVLNRGYNVEKGTWEVARGKAYFVDEPDVGRLKVSFFGPFYGAYNVIRLDESYQWSLVAGPNRSYLWILSRSPSLDARTRDELTAYALQHDFPVEELVWVDHNRR